MDAYASMHEQSLSRASAKRSEKPDKSVVKEPELPTDVEYRLSRNIVAHDMCAFLFAVVLRFFTCCAATEGWVSCNASLRARVRECAILFM